MKRLIACLALLGALLTVAAPANAQSSWTGLYIGTHATLTQVDVDWVNPGTPAQELDGVMAGMHAGFDLQLGQSPLVVGAVGDLDLGRLSACVRDGNYIVECGTVTMTGSFRARVGIAVGPLLLYGTAGLAVARMEQEQDCPDPAAVKAGWCLNNGPYHFSTTETLLGTVYGGGVELRLGTEQRVSVFAEALRTTYREMNFVMGDDQLTLPDQRVLATSTQFRVGIRIRF